MPTLQKGSSGPDVQALQQRLSDLGFDPNGLDGNFGPGTEAAVRAFQAAKGLGVDGKVGANTLAALLGGLGDAGVGGGTFDAATAGMDATGDDATVEADSTTGGSRLLNEDDYQQAADLLKCDIAAIKAVPKWKVAAPASCLTDDQKFCSSVTSFGPSPEENTTRRIPTFQIGPRAVMAPGGNHQWDRFKVAAALDQTAAIKACSWGKFQLMGFNFRSVALPTWTISTPQCRRMRANISRLSVISSPETISGELYANINGPPWRPATTAPITKSINTTRSWPPRIRSIPVSFV